MQNEHLNGLFEIVQMRVTTWSYAELTKIILNDGSDEGSQHMVFNEKEEKLSFNYHQILPLIQSAEIHEQLHLQVSYPVQ